VNIAKLPELSRPAAHSEGGKHPGQGGNDRKGGDYHCDHDQIAGHHEAMEALVLSVAGVMAVLVIASLMLLLIH
jgi:hypothetical protein